MPKKLLVLICLAILAIAFPVKAQEPVPENEFSQTQLLDINQLIYSFSISGSLALKKANSYWRVILIDNQQKEYLVYEAYPLIVKNDSFTFNSACEETCLLEAIRPEKLRIEGYATDYNLSQITYKTELQNLPAQASADLKKEQQNQKIQTLNEQIKARGLEWVAGETSVSGLTYEEKKGLFKGKLPNLQGFEYYKGGIFEFLSDTPLPAEAAFNLPKSWDWRNRHGKNWVTSVKDQLRCGSCALFANVAATELLTNLYYNQHLNLNLSEQEGVSCFAVGEKLCQLGTWANWVLDYYIENGVVDENCFPYQGIDSQGCSTTTGSCNISKAVSCSQRCLNWSERIKITGYTGLSPNESEDKLKKMLMDYGAITGGVNSWEHQINIIGWETSANQTAWIIKNSWGAGWGENGFGKIKVNISDLTPDTFALLTPISDKGNYQIRCLDNDGDKYCNWGISENKPDSCPASCKPEKDCDDSNPNLGPFDSNYYCTSLGPNPTPTPCPLAAQGDLNCDAKINEVDLTILLNRWGEAGLPTIEKLIANWKTK